MLKPILITALSTAIAVTATAQLYNATAVMDANNIAARSAVLGDQWFDPAGGPVTCEFPKGSGRNIASGGGLWMSAYDAQSVLHVSTQAYRTNTDYAPGPILPSSASAAAVSASRNDWNKIWSVTRGAVDSFLAQPVHTLANTPASVLDWPAKGNPYAKSSSGAALAITDDRAPFVDANADGVYSPLAGDFPKIKGDKMLWLMFNDLGQRAPTGAIPLSVEVEQMVYAYRRQTNIDNVVFYEHLIKSRSNLAYPVIRLAVLGDMDLGMFNNDLNGYDSSRRLAFAYNGNTSDQPVGTQLPQAGVAWIQQPGETATGKLPSGGYTAYFNDNGANGNPQNAIEYDYLMHRRNRSNMPLPYAVGNVIYNISQTQPCDPGAVPGDVRFVIATGDFSLPANGATRFAYALIACPNAGSCPAYSYGTCMQNTVDTAVWYYWNARNPLKVAGPSKNSGIILQPNPAQTVLTVRSAGFRENDQVTVIDLTGRRMTVAVSAGPGQRTISVKDLAPGIYIVRCTVSGEIHSLRFTKQ